MNRLTVTAIICFAALSALPQEITENHINKADSKGRKQGIWRVYDEDGNLKFTGEYINGKPVGTFKFYYASGKVKAVIEQQDSGRISYAMNYHPNGGLMARGKYVDQKKDSTWLYYNEEDGTLSAEENYVNSIREGVWKTFYPEGQVYEEITYVHDKKEGPWIQYFTDGAVKLRAEYINDRIEGTYYIYHLNGKVEVSGGYRNSEKDGTWVYLNEIGELEKREEYSNGELIDQQIMKP